MKLLIILSCLLCLGCVEPNDAYLPDAEPKEDFAIQTVKLLEKDSSFDAGGVLKPCVDQWICWNTNSKLHGEPCQPECLVRGDNHTFCYLVECDENFHKN